jgi:hypothetical protein
MSASREANWAKFSKSELYKFLKVAVPKDVASIESIFSQHCLYTKKDLMMLKPEDLTTMGIKAIGTRNRLLALIQPSPVASAVPVAPAAPKVIPVKKKPIVIVSSSDDDDNDPDNLSMWSLFSLSLSFYLVWNHCKLFRRQQKKNSFDETQIDKSGCLERCRWFASPRKSPISTMSDGWKDLEGDSNRRKQIRGLQAKLPCKPKCEEREWNVLKNPY